MTIDRWLMLALTFCTFVGPILAVLIQFHINQPRSAPEKTQLKRPIQKMYKWFFSSYLFTGLPLLAAAFDIYILFRVARYVAPITRVSVIEISIAGALCIFNIMSFMALLLLQKVVDVIGRMNDHIGRLIDYVEKLHERVAVLELARLSEAGPSRNSPPEAHQVSIADA
ncbi:MAG: hypothetical protein ACYDBH_07985 [Acidobacteriaceae bacterium]